MRFVLSRDQRVAIVRQRRRGFFLSPLNKAYICRLRTAVSGCQYVRVRRQTSGTGLRGSPPRIRIEEYTDGVNAREAATRYYSNYHDQKPRPRP
jgi:hypothetical protein